MVRGHPSDEELAALAAVLVAVRRPGTRRIRPSPPPWPGLEVVLAHRPQSADAGPGGLAQHLPRLRPPTDHPTPGEGKGTP
ncbi:MAG: hypothetical protein HZY73_13170 [Micropruina sp.]|nr:MAG: hypothetical protein HZY73_13170 [Micropruina sp.]